MRNEIDLIHKIILFIAHSYLRYIKIRLLFYLKELYIAIALLS